MLPELQQSSVDNLTPRAESLSPQNKPTSHSQVRHKHSSYTARTLHHPLASMTSLLALSSPPVKYFHMRRFSRQDIYTLGTQMIKTALLVQYIRTHAYMWMFTHKRTHPCMHDHTDTKQSLNCELSQQQLETQTGKESRERRTCTSKSDTDNNLNIMPADLTDFIQLNTSAIKHVFSCWPISSLLIFLHFISHAALLQANNLFSCDPFPIVVSSIAH